MFRLAISIAAAAAIAPAAPIYHVTSLGDFGGGSSVALAISSSGTVAGFWFDANNQQRPFLYEDGAATDLGPGGGQANSLNASGTAAGTSYQNGQSQAVTWTGGDRTVLGTLGGSGSEAMGINSAGAVVGRADTANGQGHAVLWSNGRTEDLGLLPGGSWSSAYAINDEGRIAGYGLNGSGFFRAFVRNPGLGLTELGTLGGRSSYAFGINASGQVVGHSAVAGAYLHAYLYSGAGMRDLGTLGGSQSYAYGINGDGLVVGHSWLPGSADTHAFVYRDGSMLDLNLLIGPDSGWVLLEAYAINDSGQIAGMGLLNGRMSAYRLDPVPSLTFRTASMVGPPLTHTPEPGTMAMLVLGFVALAASTWLKNHSRR